MTKISDRSRHDHGFSLIEMAMLMVVVGLIAAAVIPKVLSRVNREVNKEAKTSTRTLRDEVIGFAIAHCYLPDQNDFSALGHKQGRFGEQLIYRPAQELTQSGLSTSGLTLNSATSNTRIRGVNQPIAFFTVSAGQNRQFEAHSGADYTNTNNATTANPLALPPLGAGGFDDILDYVTLPYLQSMVSCNKQSQKAPPPVFSGSGFDSLSSASPNFSSVSWAPNVSGQSGSGAGTWTVMSGSPSTSVPTTKSNAVNAVQLYTAYFNKPAQMGSAWSQLNYYLHYDFQAKYAWGYLQPTGLSGLAFRLNPVTGGNQTYGLSYMMYGDHTVSNDFIPSTLKPNFPNLQGIRLLVLWKQTPVNGILYWDWLAYKNVDPDNYLRGNQWTYDGQCVTDNSVIMVRVRERTVSGVKVNDIQALYGDASSKYGPAAGYPNYTPCPHFTRTPDAVATNNASRQVYYPNGTYTSDSCMVTLHATSPVPSYPPNETVGTSSYYNLYSGSWNATKYDYFTLISGWTVNPAVSQGTAPTLLTDTATVRDSSFTTPSSGSWLATRYELGFYSMGSFTDANHGIWFSDAAMRFRAWPQ